MGQPKNARQTSRGRSYKWRDEPEFPSVTTLLGRGYPKPALKAWGERTVAEFAIDRASEWRDMSRDEAVDWVKRAPYRFSDHAAARGSDVHAWAEKYSLGFPIPLDQLPKEQRPYAQAFLDFTEDFAPKYWMAEASVYRRSGPRYAGTLDSLFHLGDNQGLTLCDIKTGKSGPYPDQVLQLAAYRYADFIGMPNGEEVPMPDIADCSILRLTPQGYELCPVLADELAFRYFSYVVAVAAWNDERGMEAILPAFARSRVDVPELALDADSPPLA